MEAKLLVDPTPDHDDVPFAHVSGSAGVFTGASAGAARLEVDSDSCTTATSPKWTTSVAAEEPLAEVAAALAFIRQ